MGYKDKTESGIPCQNWNASQPHNPSFGKYLNHSFCRNPEEDTESQVWCYSSNSSIRYEFCKVPFCVEPTEQKQERTDLSVKTRKKKGSCTSFASSDACSYCVQEGCRVKASPECCLHPTCRKNRKRKCKWIQKYLGRP